MSVTVPQNTFFSLADTGGLPTSQQEYLASWLQSMQASFPGYVPADGNPEYIQAQIFASWAADVAQLCTAGGVELFRQFGTQLLNLPYESGTPSSAVMTVTAVDTTGYTLPAFTQVTLTLGGVQVGFQTATGLTISSGSSTGTVLVQALSAGATFNGADNPTQLVSPPSWVASTSVSAASSGGVDQEDDSEYLQRLAATLQLLTPRPITATDYATLSLDFTPASGTTQQDVGRATAIDGYDPSATTFTGTTNGTTTVSAVSSFAGISVGSVISAADITAGQTVTAINTGASTLTLSAAASGSNTGESMTATGSYGNERTVTVAVTDASGAALNSATMTALASWLQSMREVNFNVYAVAPTYTTIYVTCSVGAVTGYTASQVQSNVQAAILDLLTPANFGLPQGATTGWNNTQYVYASQLAATIQNTAGVAYMQSGSLKFGLSASPTNTSDLALPGAFPMPQTTTSSVPTTAITILT